MTRHRRPSFFSRADGTVLNFNMVMSRLVLPLSAAALFSLAGPDRVSALMYDVVEPAKLPPTECGSSGCANWAASPAGLWRDQTARHTAGTACAQPGNAVNDHEYGVGLSLSLSLPPPACPWCSCIAHHPR